MPKCGKSNFFVNRGNSVALLLLPLQYTVEDRISSYERRRWRLAVAREGNVSKKRAELLLPILALTLSFTMACAGSQNGAAPKSNSPLQIATASPLPAAQVGANYKATFAASGGLSPYTWQIVSGQTPSGLSLDSSTGLLAGTPTQAGTFSFTVELQDSHGLSAKGSFSQTVDMNSLEVTTGSLPQATVNQPYTVSLNAAGGTSPYGWQISAGQLPPAVGLTSDGKISGTPTATGQYNFTAEVSDSSSPVKTASAKLSILVAVAALTIATTALPSGALNSAYSATLDATGGTAPYTWSLASGALPAGLTLSPAGQISGTPTSSGISTFTVQASDSSSQSQTAKAGESIQVSPVALDKYGGRTDISCSTGAAGYWTVGKVGSRWWFCDPLGHAFFMQAVQLVNGAVPGVTDSGGVSVGTVIANKYGNTANWGMAENQRLLSWGFNSLGIDDYYTVYPWYTDNNFPADSHGLHTNPYKLPIIGQIAFVGNSESAAPITDSTTNTTWTPTQAVKSMTSARSPYTTYSYGNPPPDVYDSRMYTWLQHALASENQYNPFDGPSWCCVTPGSPYANYMIGVFVEDGDTVRPVVGQPDPNFAGTSGVWPVLGWVVSTLSPVLYADSGCVASNYGARNPEYCLYPDGTMYSKKAWANYLTSKYGTISALNAAWGSNYTTFGSSGTQITSEAVATGDGSTITFHHTIAHMTPSGYSVAIYVNGKLVGADNGAGQIWGPGLSGNIDYSTGALSLTFSNAPVAGEPITVNYVQNGWCIGTGLLDECDQPSHRSWMGTDTTGKDLSSANANMAADAITFNGMLASEYLGSVNSTLKAAYPNVLNLGPDVVETAGTTGIPRPDILKAYAKYVDVMELSAGPPSQAGLDDIEKYYGDKPLMDSTYIAANADSALSAYTCSSMAEGCYSTQKARGEAYISQIEGDINATYSASGTNPYVGDTFWRFYDDWSEEKNWGLVTVRDNAYDGHEDTTSKVTCSAPIQQYTCGGDLGNYGDVITYVKQANTYWLIH